MPGCARPNLQTEDRPWELVSRCRQPPPHPRPVTSPCAYLCPRGPLDGNGVPSGLEELGSGACSGSRSLCSGATSSSSGWGLGGSCGCSGAGCRRKEGRERRCEELRERRARLLGTETSRRAPGSKAYGEEGTGYHRAGFSFEILLCPAQDPTWSPHLTPAAVSIPALSRLSLCGVLVG